MGKGNGKKKKKSASGQKRRNSGVEAPASKPSSEQPQFVPPYQVPAEGSIFEQWAEHFNKILDGESALVGSFVNHRTLRGNAREALIKAVLQRMLPPIFEIGTGEVIDAAGNRSKQMDIVIARKDFPALRFADGSAQYLVESVLATIEVKSVLKNDTLKDSLWNCYSMGKLEPMYTQQSLQDVIARMNSKSNDAKFRLLPGGAVQMQQGKSGAWEQPISPIVQNSGSQLGQ